MRSDHRADTTVLTIRLRTGARQADTLDAIETRVDRFIEQAPKPGRVEMATGGTDLSMVNLEQYRAAMLRDILGEGRDLSREVGGAQDVQLGGLESQVAFQRTGELDLLLFLPYTLAVSLAAQP